MVLGPLSHGLLSGYGERVTLPLGKVGLLTCVFIAEHALGCTGSAAVAHGLPVETCRLQSTGPIVAH